MNNWHGWPDEAGRKGMGKVDWDLILTVIVAVAVVVGVVVLVGAGPSLDAVVFGGK